MKSIYTIIKEDPEVEINVYLLKKWYNNIVYDHPTWIKSYNYDLYSEYIIKFRNKFFKRFIVRYNFNKMILNKIFKQRCNIYPDFLLGSVKGFFFPSINELFKLT
jgi:hypothetical protein